MAAETAAETKAGAGTDAVSGDQPEPTTRRRRNPVVAADEVSDLELGSRFGLISRLAAYLALALGAFHLWAGYSGGLPAIEQRSVHLAAALSILLLSVVARRTGRSGAVARTIGIAAVAVVVAFFVYTALHAEQLLRSFETYSLPFLLWALAVCVIGLELARRLIGIVLPLVVLIMVAVVLVPYFVPTPWSDWVIAIGPADLINTLGFKNTGILGSITGVSAGVVGSFLVFGGLLGASGGARSFLNLARFLVGRYRGGPGKVSVITSAFFGTVSGSAVANVVVDGVFNIPLMKRSGFRPSFAAAVEATTSSGGQLVPPVMGAAAFIMAELLGIPYSTIIVAAIVPVVLYYVGVFVAIHIEALKQKLPGIPKEQIPRGRELITVEFLGSFVVPIALMMVTLFVFNRSLLFASFVASAAVIVYMLVGIREPFGNRVRRVLTGLQKGGEDIARVVAIVFAAQLLIAVLSTSGLASRVANELAGATLPAGLGLVFLAGVVIILGFGVPTAAAYVLAASIATPIFFAIGVEPLAGHLFIFYLTVYANITPPVMPATYAAAAIARADVMASGLQGTRLLLPVLIVPFAFALNPDMLLVDGTVGGVVYGLVTMIIGTGLVAAGLAFWLVRPLKRWEGIVLALGGAALAWPEPISGAVGVALTLPVIVPILLNWRRARQAGVVPTGAGYRVVHRDGDVSEVRGEVWDELVAQVRGAFRGTEWPGARFHVGPDAPVVVAAEPGGGALAALVVARDVAAPAVVATAQRFRDAVDAAPGAELGLCPTAVADLPPGIVRMAPVDFEIGVRACDRVAPGRAPGAQRLRVLGSTSAAPDVVWRADRAAWDREIAEVARAFKLVTTDRVLIGSGSLGRDRIGLLLAFATLETGALIVVDGREGPFDPARWLDVVRAGDVSTALLSHDELAAVVEFLQGTGAEQEIPIGLSAVVHGGPAPADEELVLAAIDVLGPIMIEYYLPADGLAGTVVSSEDWLEFDHSIGQPLTSDTEVLILGADGAPLGTGEEGALAFRMPGPDGVEQTVRTGRTARLDREGFVHLRDRQQAEVPASPTPA